jgi:two-component sensor histidine kinase
MALSAIASRVRVIANIHDFLQMARHDGLVDMPEYLQSLCASLRDALCTIRSIDLRTTLDPISLPTAKALSVGLIVNELVTNAVKYAFPEEATGSIHITMTRNGDRLELTIADDGTGCPPGFSSGLGNKLVMTLAQSLGGQVEWAPGNPGCWVTVSFVLNHES